MIEAAEKGDAKVFAAIRKAAEKGNAEAQCNLGYMYRFGLGVEQDDHEALKWYLKAAGRSTRAQAHLGAFYESSRGATKQDIKTAVDWYRKAAEGGDAWGQYSLGRMYQDGKGVAKDPEKSRQWFEKAAAQLHMTVEKMLKQMDE